MTVISTPETDAQKLWEEVQQEREAGEPPSKPEAVTPDATQGTAEPEAKSADDQAKPEALSEKQEQTSDTPKAEEPDPFAGLSPEVKARLQRLDALEQQVNQIPQLHQLVKTAEGRVAAMQREMDVARNAAKAVQQAPTQAQIAAASASTAKWDTLKADFPDWAEATESYVKAQLAGLSPQQADALDPQQVERIVQERVDAARKEATAAIEEAKLEGRYEDWRETVASDGFNAWLGKQEEGTKSLINSPKAKDAIKVLDLYHQSIAKPAEAVAQDRSKKLAAAVTTRPGTTSTAPTKRVEDMNPQELWNYEAKLAAKRTAGLTY